MARIGFVSLGCAKNLVDTEVMMGMVDREGYELTPSPQEADVIVVNTCGFIGPAKEESVNTILEMAQHKQEGTCRRLVVAGCLVERYRAEIQAQIPEVDAVIGTNEIPKILEACADGAGRPPIFDSREPYLYSDTDPRILATPGHYAYLKIAEGCDHPCSFCVIPQMRGRFRSRPVESIVREAQALSERGVKELILIAQDSTMYGWDLGRKKGLAELLRRLGEIDAIEWIRVMYAYPNSLYDELLEAIADTPSVCNYVDIPLQNASREVLKRMKRGGNRKSLTRLVDRIRERIPGVVIRTTMIVGFPGETEEHFEELLEFVEQTRFDRLGVFQFSDEESAESFCLDSKLADEVIEERYHRLMHLQAGISREINRSKIGQRHRVLVEGPSSEIDLLWQGRLEGQAPDIDGVVYLNDGVTDAVRAGDFRPVEITESHDYDVVGRVIGG
jgi:ribosomal protein S12 methylthiotransferase